MTTKPSVWISSDAYFIGAVGVNSVDEMAQLIWDKPDSDELDTLCPDQPDRSLEGLKAEMRKRSVRCMAVPEGIIDHERWDEPEIPLAENEEPEPGFIKVFGLNYD